jgi:hypothetical protein
MSEEEEESCSVFPSRFGSVLSIDQLESSACWHHFAPLEFLDAHNNSTLLQQQQ